MLAEQNVATLGEAGVTKIVASCAHCFNTLANEYPDSGRHVRGRAPHRAALAADQGGPAEPARRRGDRHLHDPCYLGRHNGKFDAPRETLGAAAASTVEMPRHGERSFCCGAGGARFWMEEIGESAINEARFAEAAATGADTVATACPFCLVMLDDAAKQGGETGPRVADVATLLAEATLDGGPPA